MSRLLKLLEDLAYCLFSSCPNAYESVLQIFRNFNFIESILTIIFSSNALLLISITPHTLIKHSYTSIMPLTITFTNVIVHFLNIPIAYLNSTMRSWLSITSSMGSFDKLLTNREITFV